MRHWWLAVLLIAAAGFALRAQRLGDRPVHGDEAIHFDIFNRIWQSGTYQYDPAEYHGPTPHYSTFPIVWLTGVKDFAHTTESTFRIVTVIYGVGVILLLLLLHDAIGKVGVIFAAALTAASPAMVFYSRYYIQEMLLVFFTLGAIATGWRYYQTRRLAWVGLCGLFVGLMHATKETWVIAGAAAFVSAVTIAVVNRLSGRRPQNAVSPIALCVAAITAAAIAFVVLSGFFTHLRGPLDSILAYATYLHRGTATTDHDNPWYFYFKVLFGYRYGRGPLWTEAVIPALAIIGSISAFWPVRQESNRPAGNFRRFLVLYTVTVTVIYSGIRYKTPWCALTFLDGMILLAGLGAATLARALPHIALKAAAAILIAAGIAHLGYQGWQMNFGSFRPGMPYYATRFNPHVYGHPSVKVLELVKLIRNLADLSPDGRALPIRILTIDAWPLPWYLRDFTQLGCWPGADEKAVEDRAFDAPVLITSIDQQEKLIARLGDRANQYTVEYFGLRPDVPIAVYVRNDLWKLRVQSLSKRNSPSASGRPIIDR